MKIQLLDKLLKIVQVIFIIKSRQNIIQVKEQTMEIHIQQSNAKFISKQIMAFIGIAAINTVTFPLEMIRTRLQTIPELIRLKSIQTSYRGVLDCVSRIFKEEGSRAFWKGNLANIFRVIPNETFNFFTKESIQIWAKKNNLASDNNPSLNFVSGSIGAVFTLAFIYPMDYARARLTNEVSAKSSITKVLKRTYQLEGLKGIYRGSVNFFISAAIFRAFYFGIFDTIKKKKPTNLNYRLVGSYIGSLTAIYLVYPFDTIRKRMMMTSGQAYKYGGFIDCLTKMIKYEGIKSLYKGWQLSLGQGLGAAGCLVLFDAIGTDVKKIKRL